MWWPVSGTVECPAPSWLQGLMGPCQLAASSGGLGGCTCGPLQPQGGAVSVLAAGQGWSLDTEAAPSLFMGHSWGTAGQEWGRQVGGLHKTLQTVQRVPSPSILQWPWCAVRAGTQPTPFEENVVFGKTLVLRSNSPSCLVWSTSLSAFDVIPPTRERYQWAPTRILVRNPPLHCPSHQRADLGSPGGLGQSSCSQGPSVLSESSGVFPHQTLLGRACSCSLRCLHFQSG